MSRSCAVCLGPWACAFASVLSGCSPATMAPPPSASPPPVVREVRRPALETPAPTPAPVRSQSAGRDEIPPERQAHPKDSWDTEKDHRFAEFLREKAANMIRQSTVGLERRGRLRIQLSKSVSPEETLPLTKSVLAGARKDFPGRPFVMSVYDPDGEAILRAHYDPDRGVRYEVVRDEGDSRTAGSSASPRDAVARGGTTERDRKFAEWAERHGRPFLRYVQADLERNGRLWFGITREVPPADLPDLTRSLLQGASKEFPRRELTAVAFDPDGGRIGRAHLRADGSVRWEKD